MTLGNYPTLSEYDEKCIHKKKLEDLLNFTHYTTVNGKIEILKHLKTDPLYKCYFCNGYNYNCEAYEEKYQEEKNKE